MIRNYLGNATVVKIENECTDGGTAISPWAHQGDKGNKGMMITKYAKQVHFLEAVHLGFSSIRARPAGRRTCLLYRDNNGSGHLLGLARPWGMDDWGARHGFATLGAFARRWRRCWCWWWVEPFGLGQAARVVLMCWAYLRHKRFNLANLNRSYAGGVAGLDAGTLALGRLARLFSTTGKRVHQTATQSQGMMASVSFDLSLTEDRMRNKLSLSIVARLDVMSIITQCNRKTL